MRFGALIFRAGVGDKGAWVFLEGLIFGSCEPNAIHVKEYVI